MDRLSPARRPSTFAWSTSGLVAIALLFLVAGPTASIVTGVFQNEDGAFSWERWRVLPQLLPALWTTTWVVVASVLLAAAIGVPLAIGFAVADFPGRRICAALALLPVTLPPLVGALAVRAVAHELGMLPRLARAAGWESAPSLDGWTGVLAVHALTMYPIVMAFCMAALARLDASQLEAARIHGAGRWSTGWRVLLPALRPALAASCTLVALTALASFTAPYYWKHDGDFLTLLVYQCRQSDPARSLVGTFLLTLLALGVLTVFMALEGRAAPPVTRGVGRPLATAAAGRSRGPWRWVLAASLAAFTALALLPQVAIVLLGLASGWRHDEPIPQHYGLGHFRAILSDPASLAPLQHSVAMAGLAVIAAIVLGGAAAWWRRRFTIPGGRLVEVACMLPFALPGTVLALAFLAYFSTPAAFGLVPRLSHTLVILPIAYAVRILPLCYRGTSAALAGLDPALEQAAATLGASPLQRLTRVLVPLIAPTVLAAALLAFLTAAGELPASILLYIPENQPVSVRIDTLFRTSRFGPPFAYATLLLALQLVTVLAAAWISRGRSRPART